VAYLSLYRKYRPQTFAEVVGQDHVTTTLANAVTEQRLSHAYLFTGPRGTGKTSTARILAKALNCENGPTSTPCNACGHCLAITAGSSVDVIEIDAASHGGVDDVRDLRERVVFAPAAARTKVYIVDECHMLSTAGWNAFLKTVEEPPSHVLFVFATTEPHKVLETILSRTQRFDFKRVGAGALAEHVRELGRREGLEFAPGAVDLIVRAGDGSVRDALSVLDQVVAFTGPAVSLEGVTRVLGAAPDEPLLAAAGFIAAGDVAGLCRLVQRLADAGQDLRQFARDAVEHLRALFLLQVAPDGDLVDGSAERLERLRDVAGRLGRVELLRAIELLGEAQAQMRRGNTRLPLEVALVKAALPEACGDPAALAARLERLERRMGAVGTPIPSGAPPPQASASLPGQVSPSPTILEPAPGNDCAGHADVAPAADPGPGAESPPAAEPRPSVELPHRQPEPAARLDLELVLASWPAVLEATKTRTRRLHALLGEGSPVELSADTVTLEFPTSYRYHAEYCGTEQSQTTLGEVFTEIFGERLRVRCTVAGGDEHGSAGARVRGGAPDALSDEAEDVAETEAAEAAGELPDPEQAHTAAVETLVHEFGAIPLDWDDPR
jgi:DNA polymerase-3 subunit gamma/tau